jgi:(R,R)-butanediol dehydrogenase/meso-butanediol dehydrogenase/diacetyl reductase
MPAAVYVGGGRVEVQHLDVAPAGPGEAVVEVSHCGICGTDLHLVLEEYARPGAVLGHEWAGTVVDVGDGDGADEWRPGTRVVAGPLPGCGECRPCRRGRPSVCTARATPDFFSGRGAFCRYVTVAAARLIELPPALSTRHAALTEPTAIALHTVGLSGVEAGDRVLVTGAGPVGLLTIAVLRHHGVDNITVSEPSPVRRERAIRVGAAHAVEPGDLPVAPMGRPVATPYAIAFECSGHATAAEQALDQLEPAGTLVFVGTGHDLPRLNHNRMIVLELSALGAYNYDAGGFAPAVALLASGALPLDLLVEPVDVRLDELDRTLRRLASGEIVAKPLVRPEVAP